jgi:hypothetical protein
MLVHPVAAFVSTAAGFDVVLSTSDILDDTNIHVRSKPEMFEPVRANFRDGTEEATARPGEHRNVQR